MRNSFHYSVPPSTVISIGNKLYYVRKMIIKNYANGAQDEKLVYKHSLFIQKYVSQITNQNAYRTT